MKLSKRTESAVCFAQWCINNELEPRDVGELRTLVNKRARIWVRQNNQETDWNEAERKISKVDKEIEVKAKDMGLTDMDWPGLYPSFTTPAGFRNSMLPEI